MSRRRIASLTGRMAMPLVLVDSEARDPADAESAGDEAARGERFAGRRDDVGLEADVAAGLDEEAVG